MKYLKKFENYISINRFDYTEQELDYIKSNSKFQFDDYVRLNRETYMDTPIKKGTVCKIIKITSHNYTDYDGKNKQFFGYKIEDIKGNLEFFNQGSLDFATPKEIEKFKVEEHTNKYNL